MKKITLLLLTLLISCFSFAQATDLYYIDYTDAKINKLALDGSGTVTEVLDVASSSGAYTAYSTTNQKVYWSDFDQALGSNNIWRMNLDGSNPEAVVSSLNDPWGIAIDDTNGKIYWVDSDGTVSRADLDGTNQEIGFFSLDDITAIALDVANTRMYLYNYADDTLHSVNMDGTDDQTILTGVYGFSLYVDSVNDKLYFDEQYTDKLMMTDLDGMNPVDINPALGGGVYTYGIDIDYVTNKLYYSARQAGEIYKSDLDGSNLEVLKTGLTSPRGIFLYSAPAQSKVWDIGTTSSSWPIDLAQLAATVDPTPPNTYIIDGLTVFAGSSAFGGMRPSSLSTGSFSDGYVPDQEWQSTGSSSGSVALPSRRYFKFPVSGPSTIKVWFASNSTSIAAVRSCQIGDGVNPLGTLGSTWRQDPQIITATYSGGGDGNIYISSDQSILYYKIEVIDGVLGTNDFSSSVSTNIKAIGSRIYVSNVKTKTEVNIYSITGALVKSIKTNEDIDFTFRTGLFIAIVKTDEGQKAVKLLTH